MYFDFLLKKRGIVCPYDMSPNNYRGENPKCPKCGQAYPPIYLKDFSNALPFFMQLTGTMQVGKTVYLQSLTMMLKRLNRNMADYFSQGLTDETNEFLADVKTFEMEGALPMRSQLELATPYIMELFGLNRWGSRTLVMRDIAGEAFNQMDFRIEYMPYFLNVPTTIMMFSPADLQKNGTIPMDVLMSGFINTMERNHFDYQKNKRLIIVALTKADKLYDSSLPNALPQELIDYLEDDPLRTEVNMDNPALEKYIRKMGQISEVIKGYVDAKLQGGRDFIRQAKMRKIQLVFTVVSSTGGDPRPHDNKLTFVDPKRVLDPLFFALDFQSKE